MLTKVLAAILGTLVCAGTASTAVAQARSATQFVEDLVRALNEERSGVQNGVKPYIINLARDRPTIRTELSELDGVLFKGTPGALKFELEQSGHLFNRGSIVGHHVTSLDPLINDARPEIVDGIQKLGASASKQDIIDLVQAELSKKKLNEPAVEFEVLTGKLKIKPSIDNRWVKVGLGEVNLYGVTATVGAAIAACFELNSKSAPTTSIGAFIDNCVHQASIELKKSILSKMFEHVSANMMEAVLEEPTEDFLASTPRKRAN